MSESIKGLLICWASVVVGLMIGLPLSNIYGEIALIIPVITFIIGLFIERKVKKDGWVKSGKRQYEERKRNRRLKRIKPCKKCGSNYIVTLAQSNYYFEGPSASNNHKLQCTECGHESRSFDTINKAYADWNKPKIRKKKKVKSIEWDCRKCQRVEELEI